MNAVHFHLLLNHVPVLGTVFGLGLLMIAHLWRSDAVFKATLCLLLVTALVAIPVYLTGEPAEDAVSGLPGVTENLIEKHEDAAAVALGGVLGLGLLSLAGLVIFRGERTVARGFAIVTFIATLSVSALMGYTANLGGQIRHTEIRTGATVPAAHHE
jgi:hypothetical protein